MVNRDELRLVRRAVEHGWITGEKIYECIEGLAAEQPGVTLPDILLRKGYLTWKQLKAIEIEIEPKQEIDSSSPGTGKNVGHYELLERIGEGAMGTIYKARHNKTHRIVALKVLNEDLAKDQEFVSRFFREARNSGKLKNHDNIVQAYDWGEHEGQYYFAMELVKGRSLAEILWQKKKLEEYTALTITRQVARALQHAHKFAIIHRDIKPENILISQEGVVKLCDLGLAKDLLQDCYRTNDGVTLGTASYVSPEQASCEKNIDIRADIYSLGITLYQMLTGELPFDEGNSYQISQQHIHKELPPIQNKNPKLSTGVIRLVHKMTAKKPENRYHDPEELLHELDSLLSSPIPGSDKTVSKQRPPTRMQMQMLSTKKNKPQILWIILYITIGISAIVLALLWAWIWFGKK